MTTSVIALLAALTVSFLAAPTVAQTVNDLPKGVVKVSGVVPGMGEHWANRKMGGHKAPIYGVMDGKVVFYEFEVLAKDMTGKEAWELKYDYPAIMTKPDHIDIEYMPKGHRGMKVPHFAVHMYTVSHETHMAYKPKPRK